MALYKVRKGYFVPKRNGIAVGGEILDLTDEAYKAVAHQVEPVPVPVEEKAEVVDPAPVVEEKQPEPVTEDVVMSAAKNRAITAPRGRRKL